MIQEKNIVFPLLGSVKSHAAPICTLLGKLLLPQIDILPVFWGIIGSLSIIVAGLIII